MQFVLAHWGWFLGGAIVGLIVWLCYLFCRGWVEAFDHADKEAERDEF